MEHADHTFVPCLAHHRCRVVVGIASVNDYGACESFCKLQLHRERAALEIARRVVVVVVEATFTDGDGSIIDERFESGDVRTWIERRGVVRVNSSGERDEARMRCRDPGRVVCLFDGCTDTDDSYSARLAGAIDYRVAVAVEGLVREVGVAVDEAAFHIAALAARGYLRSIQRSTGPAM